MVLLVVGVLLGSSQAIAAPALPTCEEVGTRVGSQRIRALIRKPDRAHRCKTGFTITSSTDNQAAFARLGGCQGTFEQFDEAASRAELREVHRYDEGYPCMNPRNDTNQALSDCFKRGYRDGTRRAMEWFARPQNHLGCPGGLHGLDRDSINLRAQAIVACNAGGGPAEYDQGFQTGESREAERFFQRNPCVTPGAATTRRAAPRPTVAPGSGGPNAPGSSSASGH